MRAAKYLCDRGYRNGFMLADVSEYFIRDLFIQPRIRLSRMPFPHDGFSAFVFYYADGHLCSFVIIRPVIGHGRYREPTAPFLRFLDTPVLYHRGALHAMFDCKFARHEPHSATRRTDSHLFRCLATSSSVAANHNRIAKSFLPLKSGLP